jgi:hypothetical protein
MMLLSGIVFALGATLVVLGLILSTDGIEVWRKRRAKRKRPKIPAWRPWRYHNGGCRDCGMSDLPLDYYSRCRLCADLEELYGGVKSAPALASPLDPRFGLFAEPPANQSFLLRNP